MNDCVTCGRRIAFRTMRVSFNRKQGVAHWLDNSDPDPDCPCLKAWAWTKWRSDKSRPSISEIKIAEWNAANPVQARAPSADLTAPEKE